MPGYGNRSKAGSAGGGGASEDMSSRAADAGKELMAIPTTALKDAKKGDFVVSMLGDTYQVISNTGGQAVVQPLDRLVGGKLPAREKMDTRWASVRVLPADVANRRIALAREWYGRRS